MKIGLDPARDLFFYSLNAVSNDRSAGAKRRNGGPSTACWADVG